MQKQPPPLPVVPTSDEDYDKTLKRELEHGKEPEDAEALADDSAGERKIGFVRASAYTQVNERDPKTQERIPEDAGEPANPADHADIQGE